MRFEYTSYTLQFKFDARTSRGKLQERKVWYIKLSDGEHVGVGEVAPIERLSPEDVTEIPERLDRLKTSIESINLPESEREVLKIAGDIVPRGFPSIRFGVEMALLDLMNGGRKNIFIANPSELSIPINGLVWMGDLDFMKDQIKEKLDKGFNCIKLKIGALDFETELKLLKNLRAISDELIIRLDANGAFQTHEVLGKLKKLETLRIHSIEQPIMPMQPEAMELVCQKSEIPIALDEELIGYVSESEKLTLLQELKPQFVVLKPTLHGGFNSVKEWIDLANIQGIDWWITSYLESNVGLNAIAQFTSRFDNDLHHGLGTGGLYLNNISSPLRIEQGVFKYDSSASWGALPF